MQLHSLGQRVIGDDSGPFDFSHSWLPGEDRMNVGIFFPFTEIGKRV